MPEDGAVVIESPANPRIKEAARLRERRERDATGLTLVDGGREALRAIEAGAIVETAFVCRRLIATTEAKRVAEKLGQDVGPFGASIDVVEVGERAFEKLAYGDRSDGVVLVVRVPRSGLEDLELPPNPLVVVTEDVEKPGNVGAILRSADAVGAVGGHRGGRHGPVQPERHPGERRDGLLDARRRRARRRGRRRGCASAGCGSSRPGSTPIGCMSTRT